VVEDISSIISQSVANVMQDQLSGGCSLFFQAIFTCNVALELDL